MEFIEAGIHLNWFRIDQGDTRPVGVEAYPGEKDFRIYPNPAKDILFFESRGYLIDDLCIVDLSGRILEQERVDDLSGSIHLSLPSGYYRVIIRSGEYRINRSLIIQ